jgi:hypothetical protein
MSGEIESRAERLRHTNLIADCFTGAVIAVGTMPAFIVPDEFLYLSASTTDTDASLAKRIVPRRIRIGRMVALLLTGGPELWRIIDLRIVYLF